MYFIRALKISERLFLQSCSFDCLRELLEISSTIIKADWMARHAHCFCKIMLLYIKICLVTYTLHWVSDVNVYIYFFKVFKVHKKLPLGLKQVV